MKKGQGTFARASSWVLCKVDTNPEAVINYLIRLGTLELMLRVVAKAPKFLICLQQVLAIDLNQ